jgi:hypothetical protein
MPAALVFGLFIEASTSGRGDMKMTTESVIGVSPAT